jgi:hypothetical protein
MRMGFDLYVLFLVAIDLDNSGCIDLPEIAAFFGKCTSKE